MKKIIVTMSAFLLFHSCATIQTWFKPKGFTYLYDGKYTGIDSLLNIDGYYYSDSTQHGVLFYRDGSIASFRSLKSRNFFDKKFYDYNKYLIYYGVYSLGRRDTIKAQTIINLGGMESMRTGFDTYILKSRNKIEYFSGNDNNIYINHEDTFRIPMYYHPYPNRIDSAHWVKKRKWFWNKKAWENRKK
jgi:hypothetical protein